MRTIINFDPLAPHQRGEGWGVGNLLSPALSSTSMWRRGRYAT
jgi:hypothetical protein